MAESGRALGGAREAVLHVGCSGAALRWSDREVLGPVKLPKVGLDWQVEAVRTRKNPTLAASGAGGGGVRAVGRLMAESVLPADVTQGLTDLVAEAEQAGRRLLLGVDTSRSFTRLPWEALALPGAAGPIALHPLVDVHRMHHTGEGVSTPGPFRIVVAISSPLGGNGELLNYEGEMRALLEAVRGVRHGEASVEFVHFATTAAIKAELAHAPAHVLHITGHGSPGSLHLENEDGEARLVDAAQFVEEVRPPDGLPPVVTLAACYTDPAETEDMTSFAADLAGRGPAVVIATAAPITDLYATRFFAGVYRELARTADADVVAAVSSVRRAIQSDLESAASPTDRDMALRDEWATITVLGPAGFRPRSEQVVARHADSSELARRSSVVGPLEAVGDGAFVGRRHEQRRWPLELIATGHAGIVLHGLGGIGKTALAVELASRVTERDTNWVAVGLAGPITADRLLQTLCQALRVETGRRRLGADVSEAIEHADRTDLPTDVRLGLLRDHVFPLVPALVLLDNFEDNQLPATKPRTLERALPDEELARFLATWVADPGNSRLIITTRYPLLLPDGAERHLVAHHLGPLTYAEARKLMWALPQLDGLDEDTAQRVWRLLGGHPRSMEHLDRLLSVREGHVAGAVQPLAHELHARLGNDAQRYLGDEHLDRALAEVVALGASEIMLNELLGQLDTFEGARRLLVLTSVFRQPVERFALLAQVAIPQGPSGPLNRFRIIPAWHEKAIEACEASGLLHRVDNTYLVHRWTATLLTQHVSEAELLEAHRRAAEWWLQQFKQREDTDPEVAVALAEARFHLFEAGETDEASTCSLTLTAIHQMQGGSDQYEVVAKDTLRRLPVWHPSFALWLRELVTLAETRGDLDRAEGLARAALRLDRSRIDVEGLAHDHHQLGVLAQRRGRYDEAEKCYETSLVMDLMCGDEAGVAVSQLYLGQLAMVRGDLDEAEAMLSTALETHMRLGSKQSQATTLIALGSLALARGNHAEAMRRYRDSRLIARSVGLDEMVVAAVQGIGNVMAGRHEFDEAENYYREYLEVQEHAGNPSGMATAYGLLGGLAQARGDYREAEALYRQALAIEQRLADLRQVAITQQRLGDLARDRGDNDGAREWFERSLDIARSLPDLERQASLHEDIAMLHAARGDYDAADADLRKALRITERLGLRPQHATVERQQAALARLRGDYVEAEELLLRSIETCEQLGLVAEAAATNQALALLEQDLGRYGEAERRFRASLAQNEELGLPKSVARDLHQLGMLSQYRGRYEEAEAYYRRALEIGESLPDPALVSRSTHQLGELAFLRGDHDTSGSLYRESLAIDEQLDNLDGVATSYRALAQLARARGDREDATRLCHKALAISERLGDLAGIASAQRLLAGLLGDQGQENDAEPLLRDALEVAERSGDRGAIAANEHDLGALALHRQHYDEAESRLRRALEIRVEMELTAEIAQTQDELGVLARRRGDLATAASLHQQALDAYDDLGDGRCVARVLEHIAELALVRGDDDGANRAFGAALVASQRINDTAASAYCLRRLAALAEARGDIEEAGACFRRSQSLWQELGDLDGVADDHHNLGLLLARDHASHAAAVAHHEESLRLRRQLGEDEKASTSLIELSSIALQRGLLDHAGPFLEEVLALAEGCGARANIAQSHEKLSRLASWSGDSATADTRCHQALALYDEMDDRAGIARCHSQLGQNAYARSDWTESVTSYRHALDLFEAMGDFGAVAEINYMLGLVAAPQGQLDEAREHHRRALELSQQARDQIGIAHAYQGFGDVERLSDEPLAELGWHLRALRILFPRRHISGVNSIQALLRIRAAMGRAAFVEALELNGDATELDPQELCDYLDELEERAQ